MLVVPSFHRTDYDDEYIFLTPTKHRSKSHPAVPLSIT